MELIARRRHKQQGALLEDESMNNNQTANQNSHAKNESKDEDLEITPISHRYTLYAKVGEYQALSTVTTET